MVATPLMDEFVSLRQAMDQLVNESLSGVPYRALWRRNGGNGWTGAALPLDVYTTPEAAVIVAAVPGLAPDQLEVTVNKSTVVLGGQIASVAESEEAKGAAWYLHELPHGKFQRAVTLPFEIDAAKAEATFADGIVRITLPKAEHAKPKRIAVRGVGAAPAVGAGSQTEAEPEQK